MRNPISALIGSLLGAGLVGLMLFVTAPWKDSEPHPEASEPAALSALKADLERMREQFEAERAIREALQREFAALRSRLDAPGAASAAASPPRSPVPTPSGDSAASVATSSAAESESEALANAPAARPWFDTGSLEAAGLLPSEVERIRARWEEYVLAKLELENERARRGSGWTEVAGAKAFGIDSQLRADLGEEGYDAMLFASGRHNRVIFSELLESSPAAAAGVSAGDVLLSYDDQRIFTASALRLLSALDDRGDWIPIRVLRDGQELRFFVRRGPLGARLQAAKLPPDHG